MVPYDELKKMSHKELDKELEQTTIELLRLRLAVSTRQSTQTDGLKKMRKYIARIKTLKHVLPQDKLKENPKSSVTK